MVYLLIGSHSFKVLVGDPNCPSLTDYGLIALKKRQDLQQEEELSLKKIKLSHLMPGREKEETKEDSKSETEEEAPVQLLEGINEKTFLKSSVSDVTRLVTMPVIALGD